HAYSRRNIGITSLWTRSKSLPPWTILHISLLLILYTYIYASRYNSLSSILHDHPQKHKSSQFFTTHLLSYITPACSSHSHERTSPSNVCLRQLLLGEVLWTRAAGGA